MRQLRDIATIPAHRVGRVRNSTARKRTHESVKQGTERLSVSAGVDHSASRRHGAGVLPTVLDAAQPVVPGGVLRGESAPVAAGDAPVRAVLRTARGAGAAVHARVGCVRASQQCGRHVIDGRGRHTGHARRVRHRVRT